MTTPPSATSTLMLGTQPFTPGTSRVTVLGGGVMGPGIALVFAEKGYQVDLCDIHQAGLDKGLQSLRDGLALKVSENLLTQEAADAALACVQGHVGIEAAIAAADLVIEAVPENKDIKRQVFETISRVGKPTVITWSNTSSLDVFTLSPDRLRGRLVVAHWFAPAQIIPLVEVVGCAPHTDTLMQQTCDVLKAVGKTPVRLNKMVNGFVINRLQRLLGREIFYLLESGVISPEDMDIAVRASIAPRMQVLGVVQRYDFTGLGLSVRNFRDPDFRDAPFEEVPKHLLDRVNDGHLGVATGQGFFDYGSQSALELQNERDRHLYRVMERLSHYVDGPRPVR